MGIRFILGDDLRPIFNTADVKLKEAKEMQITEMFDGKMCCEEMEQVTGLLERSATTGNYYFSTSKGDMKFCPFCGMEIDKTIKKQIKR